MKYYYRKSRAMFGLLMSIILAVMFTTVFSPSASASTEAGDFEFTLSGNGASEAEFDGNAAAASFSFGYYASGNTVWSLRQSIAYVDASDDSLAGSTFAFVDYHLDLGAVQPFAGIGVGYTYGSDISDEFSFEPEIGAKLYVKEDVFVYGAVGHNFAFDDVEDQRFWRYTIGLGFNW